MAIENPRLVDGRPERRLRELYLLRFVAAAAVMLHHFTGVPAPEWPGGSAREVVPRAGPASRATASSASSCSS